VFSLVYELDVFTVGDALLLADLHGASVSVRTPAEQRLANEKIASKRADDKQGWADEERG